MINFRYTEIGKLGEGGSGEVFLVEDTARNRQVALKVLHAAELIGKEADEAFQNEVAALLRLSHPNLVRMYDVGTVRHATEPSLEHRRYFTMELVRGTDSLTWMSSAAPHPEREATLEVLLLQALSALAYVHREGVIHYDVKPQNFVLAGEQGSPPLLKLMDFGFSKRTQKEESSPRGTLEYTAPELLRGEPHDHRADLYSLGATFFHLLEQRCPFEASTPVELVKRILTEEIQFRTPPGRLRDVIATMLKRNPDERYASAEIAAHALIAGKQDGTILLELYFGRAQKPAFVGRREQRARIENDISELAIGNVPPNPAIVITGIEGIGKTALLSEVVKSASSSGVAVFETDTGSSDVPFNSIAVTVRLISCEIQARSSAGRSLFAKYETVLGLSGDRFADAKRRWAQEEGKYVELLARYFIECASVFPFMVLADNAHLLDESSLAVIRIVVRDGRSQPILILAAEPGESLQRLPTGDQIHLRALGHDDVCEMSSSLLGGWGASAAIGSDLYRLYGGTPGVVVEALRLVRDMVPHEALTNAERIREYLPNLEQQLPRTFQDFVANRFHRLSPETRLIVSVLSCFRQPALASVVISVLPFNARRCSDQLRFLQLEGYVGSTDGGNHLLLTMKRLKDVVYESVRAERNDLHGLIASALEISEDADTFSRLQELTFQFSQCGNNAKAIAYGEQAGDEGMRVFAFKRALELYDDAIAAAVATREEGRLNGLRTKYTAGLFRSGMYQEAVQLGKELVRHEALSANNRFMLLKTLGLSLSRLGEIESAQTHLTEALQVSDDEGERLTLKQELVGVEVAAGRYAIAEEMCREQLVHARRRDDRSLMSAIYNDMGIAAFYQNRFDEAAGCFRQALAMYDLMNEKTQIANAMNNIGNALSAKGDFSDAIEQWEKALAESRRYGTLSQQAQIQNNLGIAYFNLKQYRRAKELYTEARTMSERMQSRIGLAYALSNLSEVMFAEGEYESALHNWEKAADVYRELDNTYGYIESSLHIANTYHRLGDYDAMTTWLGNAEAGIDERKMEMFLPRYNFLRGELLLVREEIGAASELFRLAQQGMEGDNKKEMYWLCVMKGAECLRQMGDSAAAFNVLRDLLNDPCPRQIPAVAAEANYRLGQIAATQPALGAERPLQYFKRGIEAIAKEPIGEITWQLTFAIASEYHRRGQQERAKEFLLKTKLVLEFFLSHITSPEVKQRYMNVHNKARVLATIASIAKQ